MSVKLQNYAEGQVTGTTATAGSGGNTGGTSGNFFDTITKGTGSTVTFDSTQGGAHGVMAYKLSPGSGAVACALSWVASLTGSSIPTVYFRICLYMPSIPTANTRVFTAVTPANVKCAALIVLATTGKLQWQNTSSATITLPSGNQFSTACATGQWIRIEGFVTGDGSVGQVSASLYNNFDSLTATETETSAATQNTSGAIGKAVFGPNADTAAVPALWVDDLGASDTALLGPAWTTIGISDNGSGSDSISDSAVVALRGGGSALDTMSVSATTGIRDGSSGTDGLGDAVTSSLPDQGSSHASIVTSASVSMAEASAGASSIADSVSAFLADQAAASNTISGSATVAIPDSGMASDQVVVTKPKSFSDAGAGQDSVRESVLAKLPDSAHAADIVTASVTTGLGDHAAGSEHMGDSIATVLIEHGSSNSAIAASVVMALADIGIGTESVLLHELKGFSDSGSASDIIVASILARLGDIGEGIDAVVQYYHVQDRSRGNGSVVVSVAVSMAEVGQGIDTLHASSFFVVGISDASHGADSIAVLSGNSFAKSMSDGGSGSESVLVRPRIRLQDIGVGHELVRVSADMWLGFDNPVLEGHTEFDPEEFMGAADAAIGFVPPLPYSRRTGLIVVPNSWRMEVTEFMAHMEHMHSGSDPFSHKDEHIDGQGGTITHIHR